LIKNEDKSTATAASSRAYLKIEYFTWQQNKTKAKTKGNSFNESGDSQTSTCSTLDRIWVRFKLLLLLLFFLFLTLYDSDAAFFVWDWALSITKREEFWLFLFCVVAILTCTKTQTSCTSVQIPGEYSPPPANSTLQLPPPGSLPPSSPAPTVALDSDSVTRLLHLETPPPSCLQSCFLPAREAITSPIFFYNQQQQKKPLSVWIIANNPPLQKNYKNEVLKLPTPAYEIWQSYILSWTKPNQKKKSERTMQHHSSTCFNNGFARKQVNSSCSSTTLNKNTHTPSLSDWKRSNTCSISVSKYCHMSGTGSCNQQQKQNKTKKSGDQIL
jgi:hypothetical protein